MDYKKKELFLLQYVIVTLLYMVNPFIIEASHITYEYSPSSADYTIKEIKADNNRMYSRIEWPEMSPMDSELGIPEIPGEVITLRIPQNCTNIKIKINEIIKGKTTNLTYPLYPKQPDQKAEISTETAKFINESMIQYLDTTPILSIVDEGYILGDIHIVNVKIQPMIYNHGELTVTLIDKIKFDLEYDYSSVSKNEIYKFNEFRDSKYKLSKNNIGNDLSIDFSTSNFYIIVPESLKKGIKPLELWKKEKGYNVVVMTIEKILENPLYSIGAYNSTNNELIVDEAASLRAYLQNEFKTTGTFFCLLVGDHSTNMPIRKVRTRISLSNSDYCGDEFIPTDNYFSDLTTKWNLSKVGCDYYTEYYNVKYMPDIFIGRLLCNNVQQLDNYFYKLWVYESNPGLGDCEYLNTHMYFEQDRKDDGMLGKSETIRNSFSKENNIILLQDSCLHKELHNTTHTGTEIIKAMNRSGFNSWFGHGNPYLVLSCTYYYGITAMNSYSNSQVGLGNSYADPRRGLDCMDNPNHPSVVYTMSCSTTPFDAHQNKDRNMLYNLGSAFTVAGKYGGCGYIGNTRVGYINPSTTLHYNFCKLLNQYPKIGVAQAVSKMSCTMNAIRAACSLIGDPEFEIWRKKPENLNISVDFSNEVPLFTSANLQGATAIFFDEHTRSSSIKLKSSSITIPPNFLNGLTLVSVWKSGYLPFICLYNSPATLSNTACNFLTNNAYLGNRSDKASDRMFILGEGARLNVDALGVIDIASGFQVQVDGEAIFRSQGQVSLHGYLVSNGGMVNITAKSTILEAGFKADSGLVINTLSN